MFSLVTKLSFHLSLKLPRRMLLSIVPLLFVQRVFLCLSLSPYLLLKLSPTFHELFYPFSLHSFLPEPLFFQKKLLFLNLYRPLSRLLLQDKVSDGVRI